MKQTINVSRWTFIKQRVKIFLWDAVMLVSNWRIILSWWTIGRAMRKDINYLWSVHCTIAVAMQDRGVAREVSDEAAMRIVRALFRVPGYVVYPKDKPGIPVEFEKKS